MQRIEVDIESFQVLFDVDMDDERGIRASVGMDSMKRLILTEVNENCFDYSRARGQSFYTLSPFEFREMLEQAFEGQHLSLSDYLRYSEYV